MKYLIRHGGLGLLLLLGWLPAAFAQRGLDGSPISKIIITNIGPQMASDDLVRANIHVKAGDPYVRASVDKDVMGLYATGFFLNIRVSDHLTDKGVELTYVLQGKLKLTGIFDQPTQAATEALQTAAHVSVDGIAGPMTQAALASALARH